MNVPVRRTRFAWAMLSCFACAPAVYAAEKAQPYALALNDLVKQLDVPAVFDKKPDEPLKGPAYNLAALAYQALAKGDIAQAETLINKALKLRPDSKQLGMIGLDIEMRKGDMPRARMLADNLLQRFPGDALLSASRGYVLQRQNQHAMAVENFKVALKHASELDASQQRSVRLSLADSSIAIKQPQQALDALLPVDPASYAVQVRVTHANLMLGRREAARMAATQAVRLASNDEERAVASQLLANLQKPLPRPVVSVKVEKSVEKPLMLSDVDAGNQYLAQGKDAEALAAFQRAFAAGEGTAKTYADAGYAARRLGQHDLADELLGRALLRTPALEPAFERAVRLDLADAGFAKHQPQQVLDVLAVLFAEDSYEVQIRLAQAHRLLGQREAARASSEWAIKRAETDGRREYAESLLEHINTSIDLLSVDGGYADLSEGYKQLAEHHDREALAAFGRAFANGYGSATNYADAGYAAKRLGKNKVAVGYMAHALEINEKSPVDAKPFSDDQAIDYRREIQDMNRSWGMQASLTRQRTLLAGRQRSNILQGGVEAYWQPYYNNGRFIQLYGRTYQTLHEGIINGTNGSGTATNQGALGVRVKPFSNQGLTLGLERLVHIGMFSRMDWLARVGYSTDSGYDIKPAKAALANWNLYAELGYFFEPGAGNNAGGGGAGNGYYYHTIETTYGKSMAMPSVDAHLTAYPHIVAATETDNSRSPRARVSSSTIGPGVKFRYWFREDKYQVPGSVFDLDIQYRFKVDNSPRGSGILVRANYWF